MKNILLTVLVYGASLIFIASAFAVPLPACADGDTRGTVCADGTDVKTSCGNGKYLDGRVSNAGKLDDGCFAASKARPAKKMKKMKKKASH